MDADKLCMEVIKQATKMVNKPFSDDDILHCTDDTCPNKGKCRRYINNYKGNMRYMDIGNIKYHNGCEYYWKIRSK